MMSYGVTAKHPDFKVANITSDVWVLRQELGEIGRPIFRQRIARLDDNMGIEVWFSELRE